MPKRKANLVDDTNPKNSNHDITKKHKKDSLSLESISDEEILKRAAELLKIPLSALLESSSEVTNRSTSPKRKSSEIETEDFPDKPKGRKRNSKFLEAAGTVSLFESLDDKQSDFLPGFAADFELASTDILPKIAPIKHSLHMASSSSETRGPTPANLRTTECGSAVLSNHNSNKEEVPGTGASSNKEPTFVPSEQNPTTSIMDFDQNVLDLESVENLGRSVTAPSFHEPITLSGEQTSHDFLGLVEGFYQPEKLSTLAPLPNETNFSISSQSLVPWESWCDWTYTCDQTFLDSLPAWFGGYAAATTQVENLGHVTGTEKQPRPRSPMQYSQDMSEEKGPQTESSPLLRRRSISSSLEEHTSSDESHGSYDSIKKGKRRSLGIGEREQVATTRKNNACVRCRLQRIKCITDPKDTHGTGSCLTCKKAMPRKLSKLPCLRLKMSDVNMIKPNHSRIAWTHRWKNSKMRNIDRWADTGYKYVLVTQQYTDKPLVYRVRKFVVQDGDQVSRAWAVGNTLKQVALPAYAIFDIQETKDMFQDFITSQTMTILKNLLNKDDPIVYSTFQQAIRHSRDAQSEEERIILRLVLRQWVVARMSERSAWIIGDETLGMDKSIIDSGFMNEKIPCPPLMSFQIVNILHESFETPLRVESLKKLNELVAANKPSYWFTIYLATFVLLHNCSLLCKFEVTYAKRYALKTRYARMEQVAMYNMSANILLAHFHYCNKGYLPFRLDWDAEEIKTMASLDESQVEFVKNAARLADSNEHEWRSLRDSGNHPDPHYFISQLYEAYWKPRSFGE